MLFALAVALLSVAAGAALALVGGGAGRVVGIIGVVALVAAVFVVVGHLLPVSYEALGWPALVVFAIALAIPALGEWAVTRTAWGGPEAPRYRRHAIGLELGYAALLLHKVGDGLGLATFTGPLHEGHAHADLVIAIAGHTVPVVAAVVLAFRQHAGQRAALVRAGGLAVAMVAGVLLAGLVPVEVVATWEPWISAVVAGLLLHVAFHGWPKGLASRLRRRSRDRRDQPAPPS